MKRRFVLFLVVASMVAITTLQGAEIGPNPFPPDHSAGDPWTQRTPVHVTQNVDPTLLNVGSAARTTGDSLTTLFAADNFFAGNMFDVEVFEPLTVTSFAVNLLYQGGVNEIQIYYRHGSSVGHEEDPAGWMYLGTDYVISNGANVPTHVNIGGLAMEPGQIYGLYVHLDSYNSGSSVLLYTNGGPTVYSNSQMALTTHVGKGFPALYGPTFYFCEWNGTIFYTPGGGTSSVAAGCVAYYPFSGDADDACGFGNHGSVTDATLTDDRLGNANRAYDFDGFGDFIRASDSDSLDIQDGFTAAAWIRPRTTSGTYMLMKGGAYTLDIYPGTVRSVLTNVGAGQGWVEGLTPIVADQWQHVAVTWEDSPIPEWGTTVTAYFNGAPDGTGSFEGPIRATDNDLYIGSYATAYFDGVIDELWIFDRALSADEVHDLMNLLFYDGFEFGDLGNWTSSSN